MTYLRDASQFTRMDSHENQTVDFLHSTIGIHRHQTQTYLLGFMVRCHWLCDLLKKRSVIMNMCTYLGIWIALNHIGGQWNRKKLSAGSSWNSIGAAVVYLSHEASRSMVSRRSIDSTVCGSTRLSSSLSSGTLGSACLTAVSSHLSRLLVFKFFNSVSPFRLPARWSSSRVHQLSFLILN